jgi:hypothetical protein
VPFDKQHRLASQAIENPLMAQHCVSPVHALLSCTQPASHPASLDALGIVPCAQAVQVAPSQPSLPAQAFAEQESTPHAPLVPPPAKGVHAFEQRPPLQVCPAPHCMPQPPQFCESLMSVAFRMQLPAQSTPSAQLVVPQVVALSQPFLGSPSQSYLPAKHFTNRQLPSEQLCLSTFASSHLLQLCGSQPKVGSLTS